MRDRAARDTNGGFCLFVCFPRRVEGRRRVKTQRKGRSVSRRLFSVLIFGIDPRTEEETTRGAPADGFIRSASENRSTGEQNVETAAAPDTDETHRQRGGGQEQI